MWEKSYKATLKKAGKCPVLHAEASHDGYIKKFSVIHTRKIEWPALHQMEIQDSFSGKGEVQLRGAFHLGICDTVSRKGQIIEVDFGDFWFLLSFPPEFSIEIYYGSEHPFIGWKSTIYGKWEPIHAIVFSNKIQTKRHYKISLEVAEK